MRCSFMVWPDIWSYHPLKRLIFQTISQWRMQEKITTDDSGAAPLDASVYTYRTSLPEVIPSTRRRRFAD